MNDASANGFRSARVATTRLLAAAFTLVVCFQSLAAAEPLRLQVLWKSDSPSVWQGAIDVEGGEISRFRMLGAAIDEPNVFHVEANRVQVVPGLERTTDGCEFATSDGAKIRVSFSVPNAGEGEPLEASLAVEELLDRPEGTAVRAGDRELTIRRALDDVVSIEPAAETEIHKAGESVTFVCRHCVGTTTAIALDWKASLISLRDGSVAWSEERSTAAKQRGEEVSLEWRFDTPDEEGVYRLLVEAYPQRFGSRWYRGEALARGTYDLLSLGEASPRHATTGTTLVQIRPGESSWSDRARSVSPMRWFASSEPNEAELGVARTEEKEGVAWLVLEPGAIRAFPLPACDDRRGLVVEIDVAAGEPGRADIACCLGPADESTIARAFDEADGAAWRVSLVVPDLPISSPPRSEFETLRALLPISAKDGTLVLRAADPQRPLRVAEIRVVEEATADVATDREAPSSPRSRSTTLLIEDVAWPRRLSDGTVAGIPGPAQSNRLAWYEAALRLARYAKAEAYDAVCIPAIAEGGALRFSSEFSPRLIDGPDALPETIGPPIDAIEIVLSVFDRERVGLILAYSPSIDESFDDGALRRRWNDLLAHGAGHPSFEGLLLRAPAARFDVATTAQRATPDDVRGFEQELGVVLSSDPAIRAASLHRHGALWRERSATEVVGRWEALRRAAAERQIAAFVEIGSDGSPDESPPSTLRLFEPSGWSLLRRFDFAPDASPSIATREMRFAGPGGVEEHGRTLWLRRTTSPSVANVARASRVDYAEEERLFMKLARHDAAALVDSDCSFAPTMNAELAARRRTLSSLPAEPLSSGPRRTPIGDDPLRLLVLRRDDGYWVAAINQAAWPVSATIEFASSDVGRLTSLANVSLPEPSLSSKGATWALDLAPYGIVAARFEGGHAEIVDWRGNAVASPGIDRETVRRTIDDLSRRFARAGDPAKRPALLKVSFDDLAASESGWKIDAGSAARLSREADETGNAISLRPGGASIRLTSPALAAPRAGFATASIVASVEASPSGAFPEVRLVTLSGDASVATHVSARVELTPPASPGQIQAASTRQQIYVPIENVPADFWTDWTLTLEVAGEGALLVEEINVLDSFASPERLAAWRKGLAIAEYALREDRLFAASQALDSPSMRLVRACYGENDLAAPPASVSPSAPAQAPAEPERSMVDRLWNWAPEPAFR